MLRLTKMATLVVALVFIASTAQAAKSRARQNFYCDDAINGQIKMEFDAAQTYLSLASYFSSDVVALEGFAKMFEHSWKEELAHGQKLIEYGLMRGVSVRTPDVARPDDSKWATLNACEIVKFTLQLEMSVNNNLLSVHSCADGDEKEQKPDPQFQDFLESEYLKEQVEANKELADLLTRLERVTQYVNKDGQKVASCDGLGLHLIDQELAKKFSK